MTTPDIEQLRKGDAEMMAQYAAEIRHENGLKYAQRVVASPETFHEDEVLLADAITTLRAAVKRWQDDYYRMNSMYESAEARVAELKQKLAAIISHADKHYVDMSSPHNQVTFHYCAICGTNRDDVLASVPIEHAADCPLADIRSATPSPTPEPSTKGEG